VHGVEAARAAEIYGGGRRRLVGKLRKRDSGHGFDSGLAWEEESEEGNTFRVETRRRGPRKADDGGARSRRSG
jgi:hypothetical protein